MSDQNLLKQIRRDLSGSIKTYNDWPKEGVAFKDIQSILSVPALSLQAERGLKELLPIKDGHFDFDAVLAFDARGFIYSYQLAKAAGVKLIMARKPGKLPGDCITEKFTKEYGEESIQIQRGLIKPGDRVLVHDDVLATGGTAEAAEKLITACGGTLAGYNFLIELQELGGREVLKKYVSDEKIASLLVF